MTKVEQGVILGRRMEEAPARRGTTLYNGWEGGPLREASRATASIQHQCDQSAWLPQYSLSAPDKPNDLLLTLGSNTSTQVAVDAETVG